MAELDKLLRELEDQRKEPESLMCNAKKDLCRLYAERDSLKGEKEHILKEKATEETWWLYIRSFMPGKAAEFTRQTTTRACHGSNDWEITYEGSEHRSQTSGGSISKGKHPTSLLCREYDQSRDGKDRRVARKDVILTEWRKKREEAD
jgi:hypothetical protein